MFAHATAGPARHTRDEARLAELSGWLLLLIAAFIIYGSLYPFSFVHPSPFSWSDLFTGRWWSGSRGDILANLALFFPYGLFGALYLAPKRQPWAAVLLLLGGFVLAVALQYAQVYLPRRTPAAGDALWNAVGMAAGYVSGLLGAALLTRRSSQGAGRWRLSDLAMVLGVIAFEWLPFIPTLDFQTFKDNIKPLLVERSISVPEMVMHAAVLYVGGAALRSVVTAQRRGMLLVLAGLTALVAGRAFFFAAGLDRSVLLGALVGLSLTAALWRGSEATRTAGFMWIVFGALVVGGLWPFVLKPEPSGFGWVPFAGFLTGDAVGTARSLLGQALLFFSFFVLVGRMRGGLIAATLTLALTVLAIEVIQRYLEGRGGEITSVALVVIAAVLARALHGSGEASVSERPRVRPERPTEASQQASAAGVWHPGISQIVGLGVMILGLWAALRAPGLPYNVRELFRDGGSLFALTLFSLAVVFPGLSSRAIGWRLGQAHRPWLKLPFLVFAAGVLQLGLLYLSVTEESIGDISGSNNVHWFVTNRDTWGAWWREIFLALNSPGLISFFERIVRFTALIGPLIVVLAWLFALYDRVRGERRVDFVWFISLTFSAVMFVWLCKFIAFDRSSTDNLNELIARDGFFGTGGGAYLYALLVLVCLNVWALAVVPLRSPLYLGLCALFVMLSLPAGWTLLQAGLEQHVQKYDSVFSGQQFLLGPDRKALLPDTVLMMRWWIVQTAMVVVTAFGARMGSALITFRGRTSGARGSQATSTTRIEAAISPVSSPAIQGGYRRDDPAADYRRFLR